MIGVDDSSTEGDIFCQIMPCDTINDTFHQDDCVNGVEGVVISKVSTQETRCLEVYKLKEDLPTNVPISDFDTSVESSKVSFLRSELKEYILIFYYSVLVGLGFQSLGFDDDFFRSLIN